MCLYLRYINMETKKKNDNFNTDVRIIANHISLLPAITSPKFDTYYKNQIDLCERLIAILKEQQELNIKL